MIKNINTKNVFYLGIIGMVFSVFISYFSSIYGIEGWIQMIKAELNHLLNYSQELNLFQLIISFFIALLMVPIVFSSVLFLIIDHITPFVAIFSFFKWLLEGELRFFKVLKMHLLLSSPLFFKLVYDIFTARREDMFGIFWVFVLLCLIIFPITSLFLSFCDKLERDAFDDRETFFDIFSLKVLSASKFVEGIRLSFFLGVIMGFLVSLDAQETLEDLFLKIEKVRFQFFESALFSLSFLLISIFAMLLLFFASFLLFLDFYVTKKGKPFYRSLWIFTGPVLFCLLSLTGFLFLLYTGKLLLITLYLICIFSIITPIFIFYFYGSLYLAFSGYFATNFLAFQILLIRGNLFASLISLFFVFLPFILHSHFGDKENQDEFLEIYN